MFWIISAPIMALALVVATVPLIVTMVVDRRHERYDADISKALRKVAARTDRQREVGASIRPLHTEPTPTTTATMPSSRSRAVAPYFLGRPAEVWIRALQPPARPTPLISPARSLEPAA